MIRILLFLSFCFLLAGANEYKINGSYDKLWIKQDNFIVGNSGVVVHKDKGKLFVLSSAVVDKIQNDKAILKLVKFDEIDQEYVANTNLEVAQGDIFVSNYLYHHTLIIAPNNESFMKTKRMLKEYHFTHPDILAVGLKNDNLPLPPKEYFVSFAKKQNIGIISFVVQGYIYLVDTKSWTTIKKIKLQYINKKFTSPFYTRIKEIEKGFWSFGSDEIEDYDRYYKQLLEISATKELNSTKEAID